MDFTDAFKFAGRTLYFELILIDIFLKVDESLRRGLLSFVGLY